jgi:hypothetical protein
MSSVKHTIFFTLEASGRSRWVLVKRTGPGLVRYLLDTVNTESDNLRTVELRHHPLMSHRGLSNWPPSWLWIAGEENGHPCGEVGILREVRESNIPKTYRLFVTMEYQSNSYMGCLLFDDRGFCHEVYNLLNNNLGLPIVEIGGLDVSHLL